LEWKWNLEVIEEHKYYYTRMITLPLSKDDKKVLERLYFIRWIIYKRMLVALGLIFGNLWFWTGWEASHDEQLIPVFAIITLVVLVLMIFGWLSTPAYKRKVKQPLEEDIQKNQKIQKTGTILRIESAGRYNDNIIFIENGSPDEEAFVFNSRFSEVLIPGREINLDYSPCTRVVLDARLLIPLTTEEIKERKKTDDSALIVAISIPCIILLGLGWMFDMLLPFAIICFLCVITTGFIVAWGRRQRKRIE
jgi:hypothetical protein